MKRDEDKDTQGLNGRNALSEGWEKVQISREIAEL